MSSARTIHVQTKKDAANAQAVADAMSAISRATNTVPISRVEWFVAAFVASQTIGNVGILLIAIALLKGHP